VGDGRHPRRSSYRRTLFALAIADGVVGAVEVTPTESSLPWRAVSDTLLAALATASAVEGRGGGGGAGGVGSGVVAALASLHRCFEVAVFEADVADLEAHAGGKGRWRAGRGVEIAFGLVTPVTQALEALYSVKGGVAAVATGSPGFGPVLRAATAGTFAALSAGLVQLCLGLSADSPASGASPGHQAHLRALSASSFSTAAGGPSSASASPVVPVASPSVLMVDVLGVDAISAALACADHERDGSDRPPPPLSAAELAEATAMNSARSGDHSDASCDGSHGVVIVAALSLLTSCMWLPASANVLFTNDLKVSDS